MFYIRPRTRNRLKRSGEVLVVLAASFVALAPKLDEWGILQPLIDVLT
jgi:hypothetical protein